MRSTHWLLGTLCLAIAATGSRAAGTIEETGTTYSIGVAPTMGTLTKNASAPAAVAPAVPPLGSLGAIGTFTSPLPGTPGGGDGADGVLVAAASATLAGGTFNFSSFTVNAGVVLTYTGNVTILVTGDASILGTVETNALGASITIRTGGNIALGGAARVRALMGSSAVYIDAGQDVTTTAGASVSALRGDIEITAHGLNATAGNVTLAATPVQTSNAAVRVRAKGAVTTSGTMTIGSTTGGHLLIQAFGGAATFNGNVTGRVGAGGTGAVVEAAGAVTFNGTFSVTDGISADAGGVRVRAFGGEVALLVAIITAGSGGDVDLAASAGVRVTWRVDAGGKFTATAHGGDVSVTSPGLYAYTVGGKQGIVLDASEDVVTDDVRFDAGDLSGTTPEFRIRAIGGNVNLKDLTGYSEVFDARAAGSITGTFFQPATRAARLSAGAGGISVSSVQVTAGGMDLVALGPVTTSGIVRAAGDLTITSCDAGIDVSGTLNTTYDGNVSGDITLRSFAGDSGAVIDVDSSEITTDDADVKSGSIRILIHESKTTGGGGGRSVTIDSFLLPKSVVVRTNTKTPAKSKITISGVLDEGFFDPCWTEPLTLQVGTKTFSSTGMIAKGKSFEHVEPGLLFRVTRAKSASSRGTFLIVRTADLSNEVSRDGALSLRIVGTRIDAEGTVTLAKGKYTLGKVRGKLIDPCWFPQSVAATLKGPGQDKVALVMGFEMAGYDVTITPCITIGIGGAFTAEIPRADFKPKGQTLVFKGNENGITDVIVDFAKEKITVKGKAMTLTGLTAASGPVKITITLDTVALGIDERAVNVKLVGAGKTLKY